MIVLLGALVGALLGAVSEPLVRRLPRKIDETLPQPAWTRLVRRPPALELAGAVLGAVCAARIGSHAALAPALLLCGLLVPVTAIDLEHRVIPNLIVVPGMLAGLGLWAVIDASALPEHASAAAAAFAVFFALAVVYPAGMGLGDVKLVAMLGAFLGWPVFVAIFAAFLIASLPSLLILLRRGAAGRKTGIPFGPFLAAGAVVGLLYGSPLLDLWLHRKG
jgi:leader peptidase (prepilin peptidase)/N-methyltransferase